MTFLCSLFGHDSVCVRVPGDGVTSVHDPGWAPDPRTSPLRHADDLGLVTDNMYGDAVDVDIATEPPASDLFPPVSGYEDLPSEGSPVKEEDAAAPSEPEEAQAAPTEPAEEDTPAVEEACATGAEEEDAVMQELRAEEEEAPAQPQTEEVEGDGVVASAKSSEDEDGEEAEAPPPPKPRATKKPVTINKEGEEAAEEDGSTASSSEDDESDAKESTKKGVLSAFTYRNLMWSHRVPKKYTPALEYVKAHAERRKEMAHSLKGIAIHGSYDPKMFMDHFLYPLLNGQLARYTLVTKGTRPWIYTKACTNIEEAVAKTMSLLLQHVISPLCVTAMSALESTANCYILPSAPGLFGVTSHDKLPVFPGEVTPPSAKQKEAPFLTPAFCTCLVTYTNKCHAYFSHVSRDPPSSCEELFSRLTDNMPGNCDYFCIDLEMSRVVLVPASHKALMIPDHVARLFAARWEQLTQDRLTTVRLLRPFSEIVPAPEGEPYKVKMQRVYSIVVNPRRPAPVILDECLAGIPTFTKWFYTTIKRNYLIYWKHASRYFVDPAVMYDQVRQLLLWSLDPNSVACPGASAYSDTAVCIPENMWGCMSWAFAPSLGKIAGKDGVPKWIPFRKLGKQAGAVNMTVPTTVDECYRMRTAVYSGERVTPRIGVKKPTNDWGDQYADRVVRVTLKTPTNGTETIAKLFTATKAGALYPRTRNMMKLSDVTRLYLGMEVHGIRPVASVQTTPTVWHQAVNPPSRRKGTKKGGTGEHEEEEEEEYEIEAYSSSAVTPIPSPSKPGAKKRPIARPPSDDEGEEEEGTSSESEEVEDDEEEEEAPKQKQKAPPPGKGGKGIELPVKAAPKFSKAAIAATAAATAKKKPASVSPGTSVPASPAKKSPTAEVEAPTSTVTYEQMGQVVRKASPKKVQSTLSAWGVDPDAPKPIPTIATERKGYALSAYPDPSEEDEGEDDDTPGATAGGGKKKKKSKNKKEKSAATGGGEEDPEDDYKSGEDTAPEGERSKDGDEASAETKAFVADADPEEMECVDDSDDGKKETNKTGYQLPSDYEEDSESIVVVKKKKKQKTKKDKKKKQKKYDMDDPADVGKLYKAVCKAKDWRKLLKLLKVDKDDMGEIVDDLGTQKVLKEDWDTLTADIATVVSFPKRKYKILMQLRDYGREHGPGKDYEVGGEVKSLTWKEALALGLVKAT